MTLAFRNIDVSPDDPVEVWGFEGLLAAVDRGDVTDWQRVMGAVRTDPWGPVAATLLEVFDVAEDVGAVSAMRAGLELLRAEREQHEREVVAKEMRSLWHNSGMDQAEFARRLGTSRSRLNTYLNGRTVPLATVLVRARAVAASAGAAISTSRSR